MLRPCFAPTRSCGAADRAGAGDPRVNQAESEQIVSRSENNRKVTTVSAPTKGSARPEGRIDFNARAEAFLSAASGAPSR
jgi:hypothetical protein